jgi:LysM repeat protein
MKQLKKVLFITTPVMLFTTVITGCRSPMFEGTIFAPQPDTEAARLKLAHEQIGAEAMRTQARLEALEQVNTQLNEQISNLDAQLRATSELRTEIMTLRREVNSLQADRERMRQEIVDDLSSRISKLMSAQTASAVSAANKKQSGRLHTVERGQSLSVIARAYGTTINAIMKANSMANPDQLKVGQELFIPD